MPDDTRPFVSAIRRQPTSIKGLIPSLPERGKIKIGNKGAMKKSASGTEYQLPQKLDHFVVTTLQRGEDGNFIPDETLMRRLGPKPTEIPVRLLYDDPDLNFPTRYACFKGRSLWCSGDGEVAIRATPNGPQDVPCTCERADPAYNGQDKCKMNGSLSVLIEGAGGIGGVWKFRTTSYNSIVGIMSSLAFMRSLTGGILANIPLKLKVQPKQAAAPDGKPVTIYVVSLEYDGDMPGLQALAHGIALDRAKMNISIAHIEDEARRMLALTPPVNAPLAGDDADDVIEEFYPEQAVAEPEPPRGRDIAPEAVTKPAEIINAETGEVFDPNEIYAAARFAAEQGWAALLAHAKALPDDAYEIVHPLIGTRDAPGELRQIARAADDRAASQNSPAGTGNPAHHSKQPGKDAPPDAAPLSHAGATNQDPAGDAEPRDLLGDKPAPSYRVRRASDTRDDWDAWEAAIWAMIEAGDPPGAILRDNREDLDIHNQIRARALEHNRIMRVLTQNVTGMTVK